MASLYSSTEQNVCNTYTVYALLKHRVKIKLYICFYNHIHLDIFCCGIFSDRFYSRTIRLLGATIFLEPAVFISKFAKSTTWISNLLFIAVFSKGQQCVQ